MVLEPETHSRLERIIDEQKQAAKLRSFKLAPRHKILLVGPPGSGKTMTASALAGEMKLPLFTILLDGLITKYMGETAAKLRLVFDAIAKTRGVYLFDEFDAIGSNRVAGNDVGEVRRILNSFLQFLEQDASDSLIVAATNHAQLLDSALFRRFDDVIEYDVPTNTLALSAFQARLSIFETSDVDWDNVIAAAHGLSYAEIKKACEDAAKVTVLNDTEQIETSTLLQAIAERRAFHR